VKLKSKIPVNLIVLLIAIVGLSTTTNAEPPLKMGWIERVSILPAEIVLHAKLDTGADHCSLHARNVKYFWKDNREWVRFNVRERKNQEFTLEFPVQRFAKIKRIDKSSQRRPVVRLLLCVGTRFMEVDVNLVDRSNFAFPVLIGRGFLAGNIIIDSSKTYTMDPECQLDEVVEY
jgi:hypothetical protein